MIKEVEDALVEKVKELIEPLGIKVEPFPDNPDNYVVTHPKGAVLVINKGGSYKAPETTSKHVQKRVLAFDLIVMVKNLRQHQGAYEVIDALANGIAGWKSPHSIYGARLEREAFIDRSASVWTWNLTIAVPTYLIPFQSTRPADTTITKITAATRDTNDSVVVGHG